MAATLRLTDELAARLALMARVEGKSQAEVVREAIAERFERRRVEPSFAGRLARIHRQERWYDIHGRRDQPCEEAGQNGMSSSIVVSEESAAGRGSDSPAA